MTIQVGHPHECPTFFCPPPQGEVNGSTSQQVNRSTSWCPIGRISLIRPMPPKAKAPFFIFRQKFAPFAAYINHNIS